MKTGFKKSLKILAISLSALALAGVVFCLFFDEAVFVRKGTVYRVPTLGKVVALTFDDGPSPIWTPKILDVLKTFDVKATFFVLGKHVRDYPEIAKRIVAEGHEIENHTYDHHVLVYYTMEEIERELNDTQRIVKTVTGATTKYVRPPKAWIRNQEKIKMEKIGYRVVLWSLNSKDWVTFDDKYVLDYLLRNVRPGDVILFHDSGGVFGTEGGNREETVKTVAKLVPKLKERGYSFVTVDQLLNGPGQPSQPGPNHGLDSTVAELRTGSH